MCAASPKLYSLFTFSLIIRFTTNIYTNAPTGSNNRVMLDQSARAPEPEPAPSAAPAQEPQPTEEQNPYAETHPGEKWVSHKVNAADKLSVMELSLRYDCMPGNDARDTFSPVSR